MKFKTKMSKKMATRNVALLFASPLRAEDDDEMSLGDDSSRSGTDGEYSYNSSYSGETSYSEECQFFWSDASFGSDEEDGDAECMKCMEVLASDEHLVCAACVREEMDKKIKKVVKETKKEKDMEKMAD